MHSKLITNFKNTIHLNVNNANISVSMLIDNSGSMRGKKIIEAASWSYIICQCLEGENIEAEVLGFTTRAWKGGQSRESWLADGKPSTPGRLNDLRHIIYKDFNSRSEVKAKNFSLMLREGLLKENIDGEAIQWAYKRLTSRPSRRRILIVISDGAPVDDSTLSVNKVDFLQRHLIASVKKVQDDKNSKIFGVGLEFDYSQFYEEGIFISNSEDFGKDLLPKIVEWLLSDF